MECISSSFFCRFIGIPTEIKVSDSGVAIVIESRLIKIEWEELIVPPTFHLSYFGQTISFKIVKHNYVITMLAYNAKRLHKSNCERLWATANIKRVEIFLQTIKKITTNRYLRQSTIDRIQIAANQEVKRWFPWFNLSKSNKSCRVLTGVVEKLQLLSYYHHWKEQEIAKCRESYINEQLQTHKTFFDSVESNPLTLCQRRACIIDNDNNLLLAGAGTGKTSVMVGRAGYLMNSLQVQSDEILLLAYGRKAADEMDDRIKNKLSTDNISASTFHSLGLSIITQVEGKKPSLSVFTKDEKAKSTWIKTVFEKLINDDVLYRELILEYFSKYYYVERSAFDFKSSGDCYQYFNDNDIRSFKGEQVNTFGELYIANLLFSHGIEYQYKANYSYDVKTIARRQYQPDFFLPDFNIYIEYYDVDENGNTAAYITQDTYHQIIDGIEPPMKNITLNALNLPMRNIKKVNYLAA